MNRRSSTGERIGTLTIGPVRLELDGNDPFLREVVRRRYGPFLGEDIGDPCLELRPLLPGPETGFPYENDVRLEDGRLTIASPVLAASIDLVGGRGTISVACDPLACEYYLENALRQTMQVLAVERGGLLIHAAGIATPGGRGMLFAGRSGAGKSTISGILRRAGGTVLSDDLVLVDASGERPQLRSTPFYGTLRPRESRPRSFPISRIHLLEQCPVPSLTAPLDEPTAVAALLANVPFTAPLDREHRQLAIDTLARVVSQVPVHTLRFPPDRRVVPLLDWESTGEAVQG